MTAIEILVATQWIKETTFSKEKVPQTVGSSPPWHFRKGDKPWFRNMSNPSPSGQPTVSVSMKILNARSKGPKTGKRPKNIRYSWDNYDIYLWYIMIYIPMKIWILSLATNSKPSPPFGITLKKFRNKLQKSESVSVFGPRSNPDKSLKLRCFDQKKCLVLETCLGVQCTIELKQDGLLAKGQVLCNSQNLAPVGIPRSPSKIGCYPLSFFNCCRISSIQSMSFLLSLS